MEAGINNIVIEYTSIKEHDCFCYSTSFCTENVANLCEERDFLLRESVPKMATSSTVTKSQNIRSLLFHQIHFTIIPKKIFACKLKNAYLML